MVQFPAISFESRETVSPEEFDVFCATLPPGDQNRHELLDGRIVVNPPPNWPHGSVESRVHAVLLRLAPPGGELVTGDQGIALPSGDRVGVDAAWFSPETVQNNPEPREDKPVLVIPNLIVEVVSPSNANDDRVVKRAIYERNQVNEYWLVEPALRLIAIYHLSDGIYPTEPHVFRESETAETMLGRFQVAELFTRWGR